VKKSNISCIVYAASKVNEEKRKSEERRLRQRKNKKEGEINPGINSGGLHVPPPAICLPLRPISVAPSNIYYPMRLNFELCVYVTSARELLSEIIVIISSNSAPIASSPASFLNL